MITDSIADMLTRIRNANQIHRGTVDIPHSAMLENIAKKMKQEGFIIDYKRVQKPIQDILTVSLKFGEDGERVIRTIERVSTPGRRVYRGVNELKKVLGGMGIAIVSTSRGILTDHECRQQKVGGEVLCQIW